jgi:spermidine synthase
MHKRLLIVGILFVLSGLASLIYQVVWFKQLSYFLGNSTYSQSVVLATFMGGLAIGAYFWGRRSDNNRNKLKTFAFLEIGIAVYCFLFPFIFGLVESGFISLVQSLGLQSDSLLVLMLKFFVSTLVLLVPTILMGGTLPVLVNYLTREQASIGKNVSMLYFLNSVGAMIGTFIAGFYLIQFLGLRLSLQFGAGLELFVGLIALTLMGQWKTATQTETNEMAERSIKTVAENHARVAYWVAGISGLCAMLYEVVWFRLLIPILSSSTYSFTLIIGAFIGGISIGSLIVYSIDRRIKNHFRLLGICQLAIVFSILVLIPIYGRIPFFVWTSISEDSSYIFYLFTQFKWVFLILLIPTIFMGMSLPLAAKVVVQSQKARVGQSVGNVFAINTIGTVVGSLGAGLILIPFIGIIPSLFVGLSLNVIVGLWVIRTLQFHVQRFAVGVAIGAFLAGFIVNNADIPSWKYTIMLSEVPRKLNRKKPPKTFVEFKKESVKHDEILFYQEGINGTFVVAQSGERVYLYTNGKGDANSHNDLRTQVNLAQTPMILHPHPDSVFVIGFGAGTTIGNVMLHKNVQFAQVAEISTEVIEASKHFEHINHHPLADSRLQLIKDDGVAALKLSPYNYDLIISQPSNPWSAGVGNLFTSDFFRVCKTKLRAGGYIAQWINLYEIDDATFQMVLRTILSEFEYVNLWHIGKSDVLMLCSDSPINRDLLSIKKGYDLIHQHLQPININSFAAFLSQEMISSRDIIEKYAGSGELNSQDRPILEYWSPRAYFYNSTPNDFKIMDERREFESSNLLLREYLDHKDYTMNDILEAGLFQATGGNKEIAFYLADKNPDIYDMWAKKVLDVGNIKDYELYSEKAKAIRVSQGVIEVSEIRKGLSLAYYNQGSAFMAQNTLDQAIRYLKAAIRVDTSHVNAYTNLATVYGKKQEYVNAIKLLDRAEKIDPNNAKIYFNRGYAKGFIADEEGAIADFTKCIALDPNNGRAHLLRGQVYLVLKKPDLACVDFKTALSLGENQASQAYQDNCIR